MNISAIANNSNPNFGIICKVRIPMKDGTTALLRVKGDLTKNDTVKITQVTGDIMSKGKSIGKTKEYVEKDGFDEYGVIFMSNEIGEKAKEPDKVLDKIVDAMYKILDYYNKKTGLNQAKIL